MMRHIAPLAALALLAAACEREERRFREVPPGATAAPAVTLDDDVQPGPALIDPEVVSAYEGNAWATSEGKRLYEQWNCSGCHAPRGGGGMGPALMDSLWIYGSEPENIFATIIEGRPNGMPAFRGRVGNDDVWKLVAYVRTMAALTPKSVRSGRTDDASGSSPNPQSRRRLPPDSLIPPESRPPGAAP